MRGGWIKGNRRVRFSGSINGNTKIQTIGVASPSKQITIGAVFIFFDSSRKTRGNNITSRRSVRGSNTPPRSGRGIRGSGSRRASGCQSSRLFSRAIDQFEVEILK
jgi:hypothetical protein